MLKRVLQVLLLIAILMLCYYVVIWVLGLLGVPVPHQIIVVVMVILGLMGALGVLSGKADNISWWS